MLVRGPIDAVPEARLDDAEKALFDSAEFASLFPHGQPTTERPRYRLDAREGSGQQGHGYVTSRRRDVTTLVTAFCPVEPATRGHRGALTADATF